MKSKKWLISLGLAVVLVVSFALPGATCEPELKEYWYTPEGEKISFDIGTRGTYLDVATQIVQDLQDFGLDVSVQSLDSGTYNDYLYYPNLGGMQAFISSEDPSPDPWSDWVWMELANPETWGLAWNPCWFYNATYDELFQQNYFAPTLEAKKDILCQMQEILAEELPVVFLSRGSSIDACRSDRWDNWYHEIGGYATWINEYSIREVTNRTADSRLNISTGSLVKSMDMDQEVLMYTNVGCLYLMLVYENLIGYPKLTETDAYEFIPKLATDHEVTYESDGTGGQNQVWTVDLRGGVKWHDGENFTADDVVYSMKYVISPWGRNKPINWTAVGDGDILPEHILVTADGDYQVEMRYVEGYHQNEGFFPCCYLWYAIAPEHVFGPAGNGTYEGWDENPKLWDGEYIGTGPYKFKEFVADSHLLLERNDDYWGAGDDYWELPAAKEVLFQLYEKEGTMWLAFEAGEMDTSAGFSVPFPKKDDYEDNPDITVEVAPSLSVHFLGFNLHPTAGYEPLLDLALRKAIAAAIDKQNLVDIVFGGYAAPADSFVYLESPNHHPSLPNNEYDLTEARQILLDAGYTFHAEE